MIPGRRDLVGLLVFVALGIVAFASSAQALTPEFTVLSALAPTGLNAVLEGTQIGRAALLVFALKIEFNCEKFKINKGVLVSSKDAEGELTYEECTVLESTALLGEIPCTVGLEGNKKIVASGLFLPAEYGTGAPAILVEKINGLIKLSGAECPLPLDNVVKGELCLLVANNEGIKPVVTSSQAIQEGCKERSTLEGGEGVGVRDRLLYGVQEGVIDGKAEVFLGGSHNGKSLGVVLF